ncbi:MAG: hypothetical protein IK023_01170 [Bacteroidaceae bacterium]|nr:hypothetical protein [Bacteroidaceae bacterium]
MKNIKKIVLNDEPQDNGNDVKDLLANTLFDNNMRYLSFSIYCLIITMLASCSKSLTDIGYSTSPINTGVHVDNYFANTGTAPTNAFQNDGYVTFSGNDYYQYNFISDVDLEYFYKSRILIRAALLQAFYSKMNKQEFQKKAFDKQYASLCSPQVLEAVKGWKGDSQLGGWQIFKPYPGLDAIKTKYELAYDGDDWFSITPAGDNSKVRLRVVLAGKKMLPVVVEVENPAFGISTGDNGAKVGKGLDFGHGWIADGYGNYRRSEGYMTMLAGIIYDHCADKSRNIVTGDAVLRFAQSLSQEQERLLSGFYKDLANCDNSAFAKKYKGWIYNDVEKALTSGKQQSADTPLGKWQAFDAGNKAPTVAYEGRNWYRISGTADSTKDIRVQMVYCDRDMRPLIIGLCNPTRNIKTGINIDSDLGGPGLFWGRTR